MEWSWIPRAVSARISDSCRYLSERIMLFCCLVCFVIFFMEAREGGKAGV